MKVALVSDWYYPVIGGVASHMHALALKLKEKRLEVAIITNDWDTGKEEELEDKGINLVKIGGKTSPIVRINLSIMLNSDPLSKVLRDFDVVHAHHAFVPLSFKALGCASSLNMPAVLTTHTISFMYDFRLWKVIGGRLSIIRGSINRANRIIAVSNAAAKFIEHFLEEENRDKVDIIPNGVDTARFTPSSPEEREKIKSELGIESEKVVLYLSRMSIRKGPNILLKAFSSLLDELDSEIRKTTLLIMAGSGEMLPALKAQAKILGIEKNVMFTGKVGDELVPKLFKIADIFVLPSITAEAFGMVILEAMASGVPVVATRVGGIPEILKKSKCGVLVEPLSEAELTGAMFRLLGNPDVAAKMGKKGRHAAEKYYSWDVISKKVVEVYREVATSHGESV